MSEENNVSNSQAAAPLSASKFIGAEKKKPAFGKKANAMEEGITATQDSPDATTAASEPKAQRATLSPEEHKLTPEQEDVYSGLLKHILKNGQWGYKGITDPTSKEISFQSEKVAERLYGYLYRHDPKKADKLWEENTGHTPSHKFHEKIKGQSITQTADQALPELHGRVNSVMSGIQKMRENEVNDMRRQQLPQLMHMLGETDQRKIDYRRKALQQTFQKDQMHQDNGLAILKTFGRGLAHGREGVTNWQREGKRANTIRQSILDVQGNIKQIEQNNIRVAVNSGTNAYDRSAGEDGELGLVFPKGMDKAFGGTMEKVKQSVSPATMAPTMGSMGAAIAMKQASQMVDRITGRESVKGGQETAIKRSGIDLSAGNQQMANRQNQGPSLSL